MCLHLKRRVMFPRLFLKVTDDMRLYFRKDLHVSIVHHVKFTVSVGVCVCVVRVVDNRKVRMLWSGSG